MLAQGRGSAANSAVCYALGITAVDPVGMGLLFERFLSEERGEWPDIDIDLPSGDQREKVIQYVFGKYGSHGAAMTAVVITYRTRMAVREMGKVLGIGDDAIDRLSKLLSSVEHRDDPDERRRGAARRPASTRRRRASRTLLELVGRVRGLPRHLGQHSGGIVIAAGRLDEVVPIEPARMAGRRVVQWDKEDCADLGIIKIDLLGLGMLQALEDTIEQLRVHEGVAIDLAQLPGRRPRHLRHDPAGRHGRHLPDREPRADGDAAAHEAPRFYDLVVEVAIIRPGPITGKMVHPYLNRRAGREPVALSRTPASSRSSRRTLGVPLFQEQLLRIAMTAAGFTGGEAEELRRAMGFKRSVERMSRIEAPAGGGHERARHHAAPPRRRSCAASPPSRSTASRSPTRRRFALIAYASAYLKCHHPAAFLAGLLNAQPMGFYAPPPW